MLYGTDVTTSVAFRMAIVFVDGGVMCECRIIMSELTI